MKRQLRKNKRVLFLILAVAGSYLLVNGFQMEQEKRMIQIFMAFVLTGCMIFGGVLKMRKRLSTELCISLLLFMGCVMRIGYMLYTPCLERAHDLFELNVEAMGKAGYLLRLIQERRLPESNELQLYQQPFFYILGALASSILNGILGKTDAYSLVDAAKTVSCAASCLTLFMGERLIRIFAGEKKEVLFPGVLLLSFTPVFFLTGGRIGENALCLFFMVAAVLYTVYWEKKPCLMNTIILGLIYGFGMQTKISCAVPAVYTLWIFLKKMYEYRKERKREIRLFFRLVIFALISFPLGLWYSVRNLILFGQSPTYILAQQVGGPLYRGKEALVRRFIIPDIQNLLTTPYANPVVDSSLPVYLLKSELFGEFRYQVPAAIPIILLFLNICLTLIAMGYAVYLLAHFKMVGEERKMGVWFLLFIGFAVISYLQYPFGCTMDFRYYMMLTICKALLITGVMMRKPRGIFRDELMMLQKSIRILSVCFSAFSCVMYLCI